MTRLVNQAPSGQSRRADGGGRLVNFVRVVGFRLLAPLLLLVLLVLQTDAFWGFIQTPPDQNYQTYKTVACDACFPRGRPSGSRLSFAISRVGSPSSPDF